MADFITSADGVLTITVKDLFNAPIQLENWETDRAWETQDRAIAESRMSVDGKLNMGFIPTPTDMTLRFSPNSPSVGYFETIQTSSEQMRRPFILNAELTLPGLHRRYTFSNGHLLSLTPIPGGARTLEGRAFALRWEAVYPAGI